MGECKQLLEQFQARTNEVSACAAQVMHSVDHLKEMLDKIADQIDYGPADVALCLFWTKEAHEKIDSATKVLYHLKDRLDKAIVPERMEQYSIDKIRVPEIGRSFGITNKVSVSFLDREKGFEWLRQIGQGDLITETVNAGTLSSFVRNLQIEQGIDPPEDIVKVSPYRTTSVTRYTPK